MLRSRAAISLGPISTIGGSNAHWRWSSSFSNAKEPAQKGLNRPNEEALFMKTLLQTSDSALIRTWTFPTSMSDALAIIRAVERKYGLIKEFKYFRDFEVPSKYQGIIKVAFRDPESQRRIPQEAEELRIVLPPAIPDDQPGGVGLADLEEHLSSIESPLNLPPKSDTASAFKLNNVMANMMEETEAKAESENAERVITCRIQRTNSPFYTPSYVTYYWSPRQEREAIARQFLNWGGFHDFPPIEKGTLLPESDFFGSPKLDHFRMRRCLQRASKYLKVPNPYEYSPEHVPGSVTRTEEAVEEDWEPLSSSQAPQPEHDIMSVALEEIQEMERAEWEHLSCPSSSQLKRDVLHATSEEIQQSKTSEKTAEVERQELPSHSSDIPLTSEPLPQSSTVVTESSSAVSSTSPTSGEKSRSNELADQLRAARSLARQVAEEQRRHAKPRQTSSSEIPGKDVNIQATELLLEESVPRQNEELRSETTEKQSDSQQEDGNNMANRLKTAWKGLF